MDGICKDYHDCEHLSEIRNELDSYQRTVENSMQQVSILNIKLERKVNELSTMMSIFGYINLIKNYKDLFSVINDMLVGVMGVNYSTIFYNHNSFFEVEASNMDRATSLNMNTVYDLTIKHCIREGELSVLGEDHIKDEFSKYRNIKSAIALPMLTKGKVMALIYLEHTVKNYFTDENIKYLNTIAAAIRLAIENAQLYNQLEEMALRDGLTSLYNRSFFNNEIHNCLSNYKKYKLPFALAIMDIDHFKKVNDTFGHLCGDEVIREMGRMLKDFFKAEDIVCRYGGEEFAVILKDTCDLESVNIRLDRMRKKIEDNEVIFDNYKVKVTSSFGFFVCSEDLGGAFSAEYVIQKADEALYRAKHSGRNRVCAG